MAAQCKKKRCRGKVTIYTTGSDFISASSIFSPKGVQIFRVPGISNGKRGTFSDKISNYFGMGKGGALEAHKMDNFTGYFGTSGNIDG